MLTSTCEGVQPVFHRRRFVRKSANPALDGCCRQIAVANDDAQVALDRLRRRFVPDRFGSYTIPPHGLHSQPSSPQGIGYLRVSIAALRVRMQNLS